MPFNKLDHSTAGQIRPRFKLEASNSKDDLIAIITDYGKNDNTVVCSSYDRFIKLRIPKKDQHYWSPVISLSFDTLDNKTIVRGLVGPNEDVWLLFTFCYAFVGILGTIGSIYALTEWSLHNAYVYLWIIPFATLLFLTIFLTAKYGKRKGQTQMLHLLRFLRAALDPTDAVRVEE